MATEQGYTRTISTEGFEETPTLLLEQPTGNVTVRGWDRPEIKVSIEDDEELFDVDVSGSRVTIRSRRHRINLGDIVGPIADEVEQHLGIGTDLDRYASRVERKIERGMRRMQRNASFNFDIGGWGSGHDYEINVPFDCTVSLRTSSGDLAVEKVNGTVFCQTTSGNVTLTDTKGSLLLNSASGDLMLTRVGGKLGARSASGDIRLTDGNLEEISLDSASGDIRIQRVVGRLTVRTASGDLDVHDATLYEVNANTASGDMEFKLTRLPEVGMRFHSVSGDTDLYLPEDSKFTVQLTTLSGEIRCKLPHELVRSGHRRERNNTLNVNGGGPTTYMHTVSGDVTIRSFVPLAGAPQPPQPAQPPQPVTGEGNVGEPTMDLSRSQGDAAEGDISEPEGYAARKQRELEILEAVGRGELTPQEGMQRLSEFDRD